MVVTLDVSKLSGWLNADAPCRVARRAYDAGGMRAERRDGVGRPRHTQRAGEGPNGDRWGGARAERTANMKPMVVTLDVSKLSDWLNTDAVCRVARRAYDAGGMRAERREGVGRPRRMRRAGEGPNGDRWGGARAERTDNMPYMVVTLDVSKLSGWLNADACCRVVRRAYDARGMRAERRNGVGRPRHTQRAGEVPTGDRWGGARAERTLNILLMVVTLDVSKLSGWLNADAVCRVARRAYEASGMRAERRKRRGAATAHAACRREPEWGSVGQCTRGAHIEHAAHVCDAGRVETQRLVERRRGLPSRKERIRCWRHVGWEAERAWGGRGACSGQARSRLGIGGAGYARSAPKTCPPCL
eukprot:scaffold16009_cov32-Phaeocystis_antarctica.AAC.1